GRCLLEPRLGSCQEERVSCGDQGHAESKSTATERARLPARYGRDQSSADYRTRDKVIMQKEQLITGALFSVAMWATLLLLPSRVWACACRSEEHTSELQSLAY